MLFHLFGGKKQMYVYFYAENCSRAALFAKAEELLAKRTAGGDPLARFLKGQLYYEEVVVSFF